MVGVAESTPKNSFLNEPALSLGCRVQPRESESNGSYFAGRKATWSSKATPATGWNE